MSPLRLLALFTLALVGCGASTLSVDREDLVFGETAVGTALTRTVQLTWDGRGPLRVSATLGGPVATAFEVSPRGMILEPGVPADVVVTYLAPGPGQAWATLTLAPEEGEPLAVEVRGSALEVASVVSGALDLGQVWVGETRSAALRLHNPTAVPRPVTWGAAAGDPSLSLPLPPPEAPLTLGPGETHEVPVTYAPAASGVHEATVPVRWSQDAPPVLVRLSGQAAEGVVVGEEALQFGPIPSGRRQERTLTFRNRVWSPTRVTLQLFDPAGDGHEWELGDPDTFELPPWGEATVSVAFVPAESTGPDAAVRIFWTTDQTHTPSGLVPLTGRRGGAWVTAAPLAFGPVGVGAPVSRPLILSNLGVEPATVQAWHLSGPAELAAEDTAAQEFVVAPGVGHPLRFTWRPRVEGLLEAEVVLVTTDPLSPELRIPVSGRGVPSGPCALSLPDEVSLGPVQAEDAAAGTLPLTVPGWAGSACLVSWAEVVSGGDHFGVETPASGPVARPGPGESVPLPLTLRGHAADPAVGRLRLWVADPTSPVREVPLTGWVTPRGLGFDRAHLDLGPALPGTGTCALPLCLFNSDPERPVALPSPTTAGFELSATGAGWVGEERCWLARHRPTLPGVSQAEVWTGAESSRALPARLTGAGREVPELSLDLSVHARTWVDVLVVAEDRSVGDYSADWSALAPFLTPDSADYRIGVVATGLGPTASHPAGALLPYRDEAPGPVVHPGLAAPTDALHDHLKITRGSEERFFADATRIALSPRMTGPAGPNRGFLRPGIPLAIVWLAAEPGDGPGHPPEVLDAALRDLGRRGHPVRSISLLVDGGGEACAAGVAPGGDLADRARSSGGVAAYWCDAGDLAALAEAVYAEPVGARAFPLPEPLEGLRVEVHRPGTPGVPLEAGLDWTHQLDPPAVVISPAAWGTKVQAGDTLRLTYRPAGCEAPAP